MTSQPALTGASLATSQWSPEGSQASDASNDATTGRTTPPKPTECLQTDIEADIKIITAYLVKERAPEAVQSALGRISDAYGRRVERRTTEQAISQLQAVVQKLADKIENKPYGPAGARHFVRWMMYSGKLGQFALAKRLLFDSE
jgi:hypothetical protein